LQTLLAADRFACLLQDFLRALIVRESKGSDD